MLWWHPATPFCSPAQPRLRDAVEQRQGWGADQLTALTGTEEFHHGGELSGRGEGPSLGDDGLRFERLLARPFVGHREAHRTTSSPPVPATRRSRTRRSAVARK